MSGESHHEGRAPAVVRARPRRSSLHVLLVASEAAPWAKTGGLADVVGALPAALEALGHRVSVVLPLYGGVQVTPSRIERHRIRQGVSGTREVAYHILDLTLNRRVVFVDVPALFDRAGLYGEQGQDYDDNAVRFDALCTSALDFADRDLTFGPVQVVHGHDWQAGLIPLRLRLEPRWQSLARAGIVHTVHNLAYQGLFPKETVPALGLPWSAFQMATGEFWGRFSFLKAGLTSADCVTTVSPTYARETLTPAHGAGLDGVLRGLGDRYVGILNGIDADVWNPATDPLLPARFSADDLSGKRVCKQALLAHFNLSRGDDALERPLVGMVSRLVSQKGLDQVVAAADQLVALDATWIFVGTGEARYERALVALARAHPTRIGVYIGFEERLAHLVEAGADIFLMPSEFEPCGLNQMYSLRYGTVPIVRGVGGLEDTIRPYTARARHANGFKFRDGAPDVLVRVVKRALRLYGDRPVWRRLMLNGMAEDHSWHTPAQEYVKVYRRARRLAAGRGSEF